MTKTQRQIILHCRQKTEYLDIFNRIIVLNIEEYDQLHVSAAVRQQRNQTSELSHRQWRELTPFSSIWNERAQSGFAQKLQHWSSPPPSKAISLTKE